jgi:EAL domain-containing protein (putative c-di-GMP-specific phosphodiesterase class I)/GGDEF domain-containing protein
MLVFLPAGTLAAFWWGGELWLISIALGVPFLSALAAAIRIDHVAPALTDGQTGLAITSDLVASLDDMLQEGSRNGRTTGCVVVLMDDLDHLSERHGRAAIARITQACADRLAAVLREGDLIARIDGGFAISLGSVRRMDLEVLIQLCARLQASLAMAVSLDATRIYVSGSIGFCLGTRAPEPTGESLYAAALVAAQEAVSVGPCAIRAFAPGMEHRAADHGALRAELAAALDSGQIRPYFQPQVVTDTGFITGFEALARWEHPERGLVQPSEFLPLIEDAGLGDRLAEVIVANALTAVAAWQKAGVHVPTVGVNFSAGDLRDPRLAEKLKWEMDRFDLSPDRLSVEILETVVADTDDDVIVHNLVALSQLGCGIDLDDFGTGHAAIGNIRRFAVRRIKIDRSFVTRLDVDPEQQKMVAAILSMAGQLGLATLAEGVESADELAALGKLGCDHVQGFVVAHPMPFEDTLDWMARHRAALVEPPRIGARAG